MLKTVFLAVMALACCGPCAAVAWAHGVVGDYMFLEPLVAEDPTPANELNILQPGWIKTAEANHYSIGFSMEKILWLDENYMPRFSIGGGTAWTHVSPHEGAGLGGFDDLELFAKYSFYYSLDHEFLMSIGAQLLLPAGDTGVEEQSHTSLGPLFLWEKGFGDLPNKPLIKFLRPFGIQSDFGYVPALGGHTSHLMFADAVLEYSLPYLSNNVHDIGLKWPLRNLFLFNEINYGQLVSGPSGETFPHLFATPGIAYLGHDFEVALGTQLALNGATVAENHAAILGLIDIFFDSVVPRLGNWTVNRGFPG